MKTFELKMAQGEAGGIARKICALQNQANALLRELWEAGWDLTSCYHYNILGYGGLPPRRPAPFVVKIVPPDDPLP